jgi:signal transduction histidine kinase
LISPDGITYARRTGNVESSGENIRKSPLFHHVANNSDSFYFAKDAIRNIPTYFSYRKLREYPMIATVGTSQEDVLKDYYKRAARDLTSAVTMSVLLLLFSGLALIIVLHRKKMAERRILEEKRYQQDLTKQVIAAQEREREEIGRELHDNVNQVLTTVKLYLETALYQPENKAKLISKSMDLIMASIQEIRNLSRELSAPTLGTKSLIDSINSLIETVAFSSGLKIYFDHSNYKNHIAMSQKLTLYRIVQEQLNNIIKHSKASQVQIMLSQSNGNTILTIKDDGKGFDPLEKREGIGLNNITSRAKIFQGMVNIQSAPGKGCSVTVNIPILVLEQD